MRLKGPSSERLNQILTTLSKVETLENLSNWGIERNGDRKNDWVFWTRTTSERPKGKAIDDFFPKDWRRQEDRYEEIVTWCNEIFWKSDRLNYTAATWLKFVSFGLMVMISKIRRDLMKNRESEKNVINLVFKKRKERENEISNKMNRVDGYSKEVEFLER